MPGESLLFFNLSARRLLLPIGEMISPPALVDVDSLKVLSHDMGEISGDLASVSVGRVSKCAG